MKQSKEESSSLEFALEFLQGKKWERPSMIFDLSLIFDILLPVETNEMTEGQIQVRFPIEQKRLLEPIEGSYEAIWRMDVMPS